MEQSFTVRYISRKLCQCGQNGYKQGEGAQRWKLKQIFIRMRDYERYNVQAGVLVATAVFDILCFGVSRCCAVSNNTLM